MNVLVIEDDEEKLEALIAFLKECYAPDRLETAKSLQSGLRTALQPHHNLILLDMTMRNFDRTLSDDGGRPHAFAGREILRQMRRAGVDTTVIVVTHFPRFGDEDDFTTLDELSVELTERFSNYVGTVQYRSNVDEWKSALKLMIDGTQKV